MTGALRSVWRRFPPVARRDRTIAKLKQTKDLAATIGRRTDDGPSFLSYIQAERRIAAHLRELDDSDRGHLLTRKLKSYAFARSHGVDVPRLFGLWDRPEDIAWEELPDLVVVKCAGGTGARGVLPLRRDGGRWATVTTTDSVDSRDLVARLRDFSARGLVRGPFFAEELLGGGVGNALPVDVKLHAFFGEVSHVLLRRVTVHGPETPNRFRVVFPDGQDAGPVVRGLVHDDSIPVPAHLDELCDTAARLSLGIPRPYVRVDLYDVDGRIVFGEFTPRPGNPMDYGPELDERFGHYWERAQARVLNDIIDRGDQELRFGTGPRRLMIGERSYLPPGA